MNTIKKVSIRGALNALRVRQTLTLQRGTYLPSTVRHTAGALKADTGKCFTVSLKEDTIIVKRIL